MPAHRLEGPLPRIQTVTWRAEVYKHGAIGLRRADNANLTRSYPAPSPLALRTPAQQRELALRLFEDEMVEFEIKEGPKGLQAINVVRVPTAS